MNDDPSDNDRYPTLSEAGRRMLQRLREHPAAPIYRNQSGNRLLADDVTALRAFECTVLDARIDWRPPEVPAWVGGRITQAFSDVPYYRALGSPPRRLEDVPTVGRSDLAQDIARFVPDTVPLDRLINFQTTGTTGNPLLIPSHPVVAGRYLAFHKRALKRFGITPMNGAGEVGVVLLGFQRTCFTYVSVTPQMRESGLAKINLHPDDWRHPADRSAYMNDLNPEIVAGDPISFAELLNNVPLTIRPKALLSVAMSLSTDLRLALEERFGCPVLDLYSLNEVGPVGVYDADQQGHVLLQDQLYVETLDPRGRPVGPGQRGEITVTGGFNFCLPLLRYRTGDFGTLTQGADGPLIRELSSRKPIRYMPSSGQWLNNIDVSHALASLRLSRYGLHQAADGSITLRMAAGEQHHEKEARQILDALFGSVPISVIELEAADKIIQYTSDFEGAVV